MDWAKNEDGSPFTCRSCGSTLVKGTPNNSYCMVCCRGKGMPLLKPDEVNYLPTAEAKTLVTIEEGRVWQILMRIETEKLPWSNILSRGFSQDSINIWD